MILRKRQEEILQIINNKKSIKVDDLSRKFNVTEQSIRRDLNEICSRGLATRIHGGARIINSISNLAYEKRRLVSSEAKEIIGKTAAGLIPNNCSLMLNIGTTTENVARSLYSHKNLIVISNNVNITNALIGSESKELILAGGVIRQSDGDIIGESTVEFISQFKSDFAIIGASAIDKDGSILDYDSREVSVARSILNNSRKKILVCDNSKFEKTAPHRICEIGEIDIFITDLNPPTTFREIAEKNNSKIIIASENNNYQLN
ncbi:MAG: DeoR family transcriptional regulator [Candidatus Marinimicrobia bacterium]|nr:DeoR family transcriptional regulator [Candidatus Neomarinimicrobiota bacterium]